MDPDAGERPRWHAALTWSMLGSAPTDLPEPGDVDLPALLAELEARHGGADALRRLVNAQRGATRWPYPVPADLRRGLGPAQLHAAVRRLASLIIGAPATRVPTSDAPPTPAERRLMADVPPHHLP